ncbi:MAG TPA: hypothetical protein VI759_06365 [Dehalococcoidia bacterium]|nr:hypothetical protein [Dehalococcoidia bacterium]
MSVGLPDERRTDTAATIAERSRPEAAEARMSAGTRRPEVWLVDYGSGRLPGGHQEDYLDALTKALSGWPLRVAAPFTSSKPPRGRGAIFLSELRLLLRQLRGGSRLLVWHTPEFRDFVLFAVAGALVLRSKTVGVFVLRRDGAGIVGRDGLKARILEALVPWLIRSGRIHPVSDSRAALEHWLARAPRATGSLVSIPVPRIDHGVVSAGAPAFALVGGFRVEKGARHYDAVIRTALSLFPEGRVRVQLGRGNTAEEAALAAALQHAWGNEPRVDLKTGHLTSEEYAAQIAGADIVVLPYDVASYGAGTSGVLHDAIALGCTVLATRIAWAADRFADHPRLVWLKSTAGADLRDGLSRAVETSLSEPAGPSIDDSFAADWNAALEAALKQRPARNKGESNV